MKSKIKYIISFIIGILLSVITIVYADYLYNGNGVSFNNTNTTLSSTDVQGAIDELYNKCNNIPEAGCPDGYDCTKLGKVIFHANGGTFSGGSTTNTVYYDGKKETVTKKSKTENVDDEGNRLSGTDGYMPQASSGINDVVTIEGATSLNVTITYQTKGSSYSWVAVYDGSVTPTTSNYSSSISGQLYGTTLTTITYTITGDTVQFFFYNSRTHTNSYSNYLGYYATIEAVRGDVQAKQGEYEIPTKTNYILKEWNTESDGSGTSYITEKSLKEIITNNTNLTLYAIWDVPICKRSSTLHTEQCKNSSSSNYCQAAGHALNETITYGSLGTSGILASGDAFDCDINGDGQYNSTYEKFYYVSDYFDTQTQTFDDTYGTLIFYINTNGGISSTNTISWYSSSGSTAYGPETARNHMPSITGNNKWRNDLLKTATRNILKYDGSTTSVAKSSFSYSGYAARLLTYQEVNAGCYDGINTITANNGLFNKCEYLMENTKYANSNSSYKSEGLWLETVKNTTNPWDVTAIKSNVSASYSTTSSNVYSARPVIDIPKTLIQY